MIGDGRAAELLSGEPGREQHHRQRLAEQAQLESFTPDANSSYFVFASAGFTNSSGTDNHVGWTALYHVEADTVLSEQSVQRQEASSPQDYFPFFTLARLSFGASPSEQHVILQYYSSNAADTTKIKDARLLAIKADAADQYATTDAIDNNGGDTNYQTRTTLTFTPATTGDYLVLACCSLSADVNGAEASATELRHRLHYLRR